VPDDPGLAVQLVAPTDPIKLVLMYSTYPVIQRLNVIMPRAAFMVMWAFMNDTLNPPPKPDWKKEGF
jgi:hypothetical protein